MQPLKPGKETRNITILRYPKSKTISSPVLQYGYVAWPNHGVKGSNNGGSLAAFHLYLEVRIFKFPVENCNRNAARSRISDSESWKNLTTPTLKSKEAAPRINSPESFSALLSICVSLNQLYTQYCTFTISGHVATVFVFAKCCAIRCYQLVMLTMANLARANTSTTKVFVEASVLVFRLGTRSIRVWRHSQLRLPTPEVNGTEHLPPSLPPSLSLTLPHRPCQLLTPPACCEVCDVHYVHI